MKGTFSKYIHTPFQADLRPAIPPDGTLAKVKSDLCWINGLGMR